MYDHNADKTKRVVGKRMLLVAVRQRLDWAARSGKRERDGSPSLLSTSTVLGEISTMLVLTPKLEYEHFLHAFRRGAIGAEAAGTSHDGSRQGLVCMPETDHGYVGRGRKGRI